ncbi:MAG TPA: hypothetical protein VGW38_26765, partial [Chloroflexota bacterium]|nr:hypothetical protein [Chloroflexota bacterium]
MPKGLVGSAKVLVGAAVGHARQRNAPEGMVSRLESVSAAGEGPAPAATHAALTLALLSSLAFLVSIDARMVAPLLPAIADSVAASIPATAFIVTAYALP